MLSKREAARQVLKDISSKNKNNTNINNGTPCEKAPDSPMKSYKRYFDDYRERYSVKCQDDACVFATKFSPNGGLLAMADSTGNVEIFDTVYGYSEHKFNKNDLDLSMTTCLTWRKSDTFKLSQKLVGGCVDGSIITWQSPHDVSLQKIMLNDKNQYQTIDYSCSGNQFAIAGKLPQLEVYDDKTLKQITCFNLDNSHNNRILTVKFSNRNQNIVYTGSWDKTVKFWDLRSSKKTSEIFVPQICGESLDLKKNDLTLVVGSGQIGQGVQLWDLRKLKQFQTMDWNLDNSSFERNPVITYCQFNPADQDVVIACATHEQPAKALQLQEGAQKNYTFNKVNGTVLTADVSEEGDLVAFGDSNGQLSVKSLSYSLTN